MNRLTTRDRALQLMRIYRREILVGVLVYAALVLRDLVATVMR